MNILCKLFGHKYENTNLTLKYNILFNDTGWHEKTETLHTMICTRCEKLLGTPAINFVNKDIWISHFDGFTIDSISLAIEQATQTPPG